MNDAYKARGPPGKQGGKLRLLVFSWPMLAWPIPISAFPPSGLQRAISTFRLRFCFLSQLSGPLMVSKLCLIGSE
jgi:hypothetical protein